MELSNNNNQTQTFKRPWLIRRIFYALGLLVAFSLTAQAKELGTAQMLQFEQDELIIKDKVVEPQVEESKFEFDTKEYLPENFDPYKGLILETAGLINSEEATFEFKTDDYLPSTFDPYAGMFLTDSQVADEDAVFDFNTEDYLPLGFNAQIDYSGLITVEEEEDVPFDFITENYLPQFFDAYADKMKGDDESVEFCDIYPSI